MRGAQEELATFKADLGQRMESGLFDTTLPLYLLTLISGISAVQAQLEKEKSFRAEIGQESIRALEDSMPMKPGLVFDLLTGVRSEAHVRYPAGQANFSDLRPRRSEGGNTKPHEEARKS